MSGKSSRLASPVPPYIPTCIRLGQCKVGMPGNDFDGAGETGQLPPRGCRLEQERYEADIDDRLWKHHKALG